MDEGIIEPISVLVITMNLIFEGVVIEYSECDSNFETRLAIPMPLLGDDMFISDDTID